MKYAHVCIAVGLAGMVGAGCEVSDRTVSSARQTVVAQPLEVLTTQGLPFAGSPDGRLFAEAREISKGEAVVEVRDYETKGLRFSCRGDEDGPVPLLFDKSGRTLYAARGKSTAQLVAIDLVAGSEKPVGNMTGEVFGLLTGARNADHTILATAEQGGNTVVTSNGRVRRTSGRVLFDPAGNAWFKEGATWVRLDRDGRESKQASAPSGLVPDQSQLRGAFRLIAKRQSVKHADASGVFSVIWMETTRAGKTTAAFVAVVPDLRCYGFVPGRNAVYLVSESGSYIVPLKVTPK